MPGVHGRATPEGTRRFAEAARARGAVAEGHFRRAPGELRLSSIGLGTYIGRPDGATDLAVEEAARISLASGRVNVLDTAINYRYQRAERSLGRAVARLVESGRLARDEVFVSTKAGYLAPDAEGEVPPDRYVADVLLASGVLKPEEIVDGSHAMSPRYLEDQVERSRRNLGLETLDLLYLHNSADAQIPEVGREEFFARLDLAFRLLERLRSEGRLAAYGLATWDCLRVARSDRRHVALEELVRRAEAVGGPEHGFRYVQLPLSLAMPEAAVLANQWVGGERRTLLAAAAELGVGVFTSVPLHQGQLARAGPREGALSPAQTALQFARSAPGSLCALVGQKRPEHLSENLALAAFAPWDAETFARQLT